MKTLITGATGGLGRNAAEHLAAQGRPARLTGRNPEVGMALRAQGAEFVPADLATASDDHLDELLDGVQTVWHCAALSSPWGTYRDFHAANVVATARLAKAAVRCGVSRFVHISTPSIYFEYRHGVDVPETFRPSRYVNHYANTKAQAEREIGELAAVHRDTTFIVLRPRGIFGPHDRVLLPRILSMLRARRGRLALPRGGDAKLDLTYTANVVHAMELATACRDVASGEAFNISNGEPSTLRQMLKALLDPIAIPYRIVALPYPLLDLVARALEARALFTGVEPSLTRYGIGAAHYDMTLDISKARRLLGYRPQVTLAQGIEKTTHWILSHGDHHRL